LSVETQGFIKDIYPGETFDIHIMYSDTIYGGPLPKPRLRNFQFSPCNNDFPFSISGVNSEMLTDSLLIKKIKKDEFFWVKNDNSSADSMKIGGYRWIDESSWIGEGKANITIISLDTIKADRLVRITGGLAIILETLDPPAGRPFTPSVTSVEIHGVQRDGLIIEKEFLKLDTTIKVSPCLDFPKQYFNLN
jgi:hypothetical protein